jgi:uncharacterized protein involved in exopolysaccharide biosynthesis
MSTGAMDQTITADLYPEVAKSQDFRIVVAETPLRFSSIGKSLTSVKYFRDVHSPTLTETIVNYTIGLPGNILSLANTSQEKTRSTVVSADTSEGPAIYDERYLYAVNSLNERLTVSTDKKTSIITITGTMPDPYAAADLVRITSDRLRERIIDFESRKAKEQFRFIDEQYRRANVRFERAQRDLAIFADRNRVLMNSTSKINQERLQREYDLSFELFQQFSRELEQARVRMNQDTPAFTVLERVIVPNQKSSPRRGRILLLATLVGLLTGIGVIGGRKLTAGT